MTGVIKVAGVLDREHAAKHELVVIATDGGEFAGTIKRSMAIWLDERFFFEVWQSLKSKS